MKAILNIMRGIEALAWVCILGVVGSLDIATVDLADGVLYIVAFVCLGFGARCVRAAVRCR